MLTDTGNGCNAAVTLSEAVGDLDSNRVVSSSMMQGLRPNERVEAVAMLLTVQWPLQQQVAVSCLKDQHELACQTSYLCLSRTPFLIHPKAFQAINVFGDTSVVKTVW